MISIIVNGEKIAYDEANAFKSNETGAGTFSFKIGGGVQTFFRKDKVVIFIDGIKVIDGKIELIGSIGDRNTLEYVYTGRDNASDLIDSTFENVVEFNRNLNLDKIVSDIASAFDINVTSDIEVDNFTESELPTAYAGESIYSFCDKLCRIRSVILTSSNDGGLLITSEGLQSANDQLIFSLNRYSNIFHRTFNDDSSKEFDKYIVYSQNNSTLDNLNNLVNTKGSIGSGTRIKALIENNSLNQQECNDRAEFQQSIDKRKALRYIAKIQEHSQTNGDIWDKNLRVNVFDDTVSLDETMLIVSTQWVQSSNALYTEIVTERIV